MGVRKSWGKSRAPHLLPRGEVWVSPGSAAWPRVGSGFAVAICNGSVRWLCAGTDAAELCNQPVPSGENSSCADLQNSTCRDNKH